MSNTLKTTLPGVLAGPHHGTVTVANNNLAGSVFNSSFAFTEPAKDFKAGTITIKGEGSESAEFDAAFINDLKLLLEVINDLPDEHPLGELKHDMRMRRAFKRLGG